MMMMMMMMMIIMIIIIIIIMIIIMIKKKTLICHDSRQCKAVLATSHFWRPATFGDNIITTEY